MAYGVSALWSRSFHRSLRTGKPSTRAQRRERSPMAKGSRFPHGEDAKVREMRTAETILNIVQDRGKRQLPLDDVYRQLSNPDMYLRSYTYCMSRRNFFGGKQLQVYEGRNRATRCAVIR